MKRVLLVTSMLLAPGAVLGNGLSTYTVTVGSGTSFNSTTDASGNLSQRVGGFNSGSAAIQTATPSGTSYAAGVVVGGLWQVPVIRVNGGSATITTFLWISSGGDQTQKILRIWDKKPTSTTCTDNSNFASNATDDQHLIAMPMNFTPQPPASTVGDSKTYWTSFGLSLSAVNQDSPVTSDVYACVVQAGSTNDTLDHSATVYLNLLGPQD